MNRVEQKGTALTLAGVYEIHNEKEDVSITPGSHPPLNAGITGWIGQMRKCGNSGPKRAT